MKIKTDFTTNSSSSSFVCWGLPRERIPLVFSDGQYKFEYPSPLDCGGQENDFVGITPDTMLEKFPHVTFGEVKKFVANKINEILHTNLTENDISYYEEGWYDG